MTLPNDPRLSANPDVCVRALNARDPRFDGLFFVGITSTRIYCRPICPARVSHPENRRFFDTAAAAERAGFRPCRRCRPELAPGRSLVDTVSRLADAAARRIAAGALNGRRVADLANELYVSERHLRRAMQRELGVSPIELAQTHRLLLARTLLTDTTLSTSHIAYASGFQSLRRFNAAFRERYGMSPGELSRGATKSTGDDGNMVSRHVRRSEPLAADGVVRLNLPYRPPLDWDSLLDQLNQGALPGVEAVHGRRYARSVTLGGRSGVVSASEAPGERAASRNCLEVDVSVSLVPVLMPLIARLRRLFDLDAEPAVIDECLAQAGFGTAVRERPGVRIAGSFDSFESGLTALFMNARRESINGRDPAGAVIRALGDPVETGVPGLDRTLPPPQAIVDAGEFKLESLGVPRRYARAIVEFSRSLAAGRLDLELGADVGVATRVLATMEGFDDRLAVFVATRSIYWSDSLDVHDPELQLAAGASTAAEFERRAERWRPWRAYAAQHLGREQTTVAA